jgi:hypothetical protein
MKFLKVVYNDETSFILKVIEELEIKHVEFYNIDDYRQKKKALPIMTRNGTRLVPLIVFEDENIEEYTAIWAEQKPDWKEEIIKKLQE